MCKKGGASEKVRNHEGISCDCVNLQKMEVMSYFEDVILLE